MAFWGVEIKPGKPFTLLPDNSCGRLRISQATLGVGSSNKSSSVQCNVGNKTPVLLCSLLPDKAESIHLELEFLEVEDVTFSVIGPRSVHLTGYVLGKTRQLLAGDDESESYGEDVGDTDTEVSNEVSDEDEYEDSFIDDGVQACSPSPSSSVESLEVKKGKKKGDKRKGTSKRLKKGYELNELEDDGVASVNKRSRNRVQIVESDEDDEKPISSLCGNVKDDEASKRKLDDVAGLATSDYPSDDRNMRKKKVDNVAGQEIDDCQPNDRKVMSKKLDNVSGQPTDDYQSVSRKVKRKKVDDIAVQTTDNGLSDDRKIKRKKTKLDDNDRQATDDCQSDDRKVKSKKRKNKTKESLVDSEKFSSMEKQEANPLVENGGTTDFRTRTIAGGLVIEDLEIGQEDGKIVSSGRKVTVHYTGRLKEQGHIFNSTIGKSPLKFRLGKDTAMDGLHLGLDGMRAGGKRRLIIPPELGYGSEGSDGVPPNAWLVMDVELLKVR